MSVARWWWINSIVMREAPWLQCFIIVTYCGSGLTNTIIQAVQSQLFTSSAYVIRVEVTFGGAFIQFEYRCLLYNTFVVRLFSSKFRYTDFLFPLIVCFFLKILARQVGITSIISELKAWTQRFVGSKWAWSFVFPVRPAAGNQWGETSGPCGSSGALFVPAIFYFLALNGLVTLATSGLTNDVAAILC